MQTSYTSAGKGPRKVHNPGRNRVVTGKKSLQKAHAPAVGRPSLCDFLTTPLLPKVGRIEPHDCIGITPEQYLKLFDDAGAWFGACGKSLLLKPEPDPEKGIILLKARLEAASSCSVVLYRDSDENGKDTFRLVEEEYVSENNRLYYIPISSLHGKFSGGEEVRRYVSTLLRSLGIINEYSPDVQQFMRNCSEMFLEWFFTYEDSDESVNPEMEKEFLDFVSEKPGSVGATMDTFRTLPRCGVDVLEAWSPQTDGERVLKNVLLRGSSFIDDPLDLGSLCDFPDFGDGVDDNVDEYISFGELVSIIWSESYGNTCEMMIENLNQEMQSGCCADNGITNRRDIGSEGPVRTGEGRVFIAIQLVDDLIDALTALESANN